MPEYNQSERRIPTHRHHKRREFTYEREARVVRWVVNPKSFGKAGTAAVSIPIEPSELIDKIVVSPYAPHWYADVVKDVVNRIEPLLGEKITPSSMNSSQ